MPIPLELLFIFKLKVNFVTTIIKLVVNNQMKKERKLDRQKDRWNSVERMNKNCLNKHTEHSVNIVHCI